MEEVGDPEREPEPVRPHPDHTAQARRIAQELARLRFVLPGSVMQRYTRCGRVGCRCMADPPQPHGPYWWWTRKVANRTVTRVLTDEQYADYQPWFANSRRLKELTAELEALSLAAVEADPRSTRQGGRRQAASSATTAVDKARSRRR